MTDRQTRYRNRKGELGLVRVELLVPKTSERYVKSYARALRDADKLGVNPPLFEGMSGNSDGNTKLDQAKNAGNVPSSTTSSAVVPNKSDVKLQPNLKSVEIDKKRTVKSFFDE